ncbi:ATP-dependent Clp protease adapter ClpS [Blastomonas aquatica]|uniref:ATP-dependent Clp protease adapter protein ClpS n=1 Tax=Blastomonas aquatica TaxID=1510276 RepID=A0ABQ1J9B3_9SPHN|nr:ATP-dependent Clp protease adapter ClpS [Blastomonas aquatica]GGB63266.1 ATP-dependent Clp protease adapter protein ClpS [Blastomonas aquatica]
MHPATNTSALRPARHDPALRGIRLPVHAGPDREDGNDDGPPDIGIAVKTRAKSKKPSQYKVLMLNDDYTPMEFVVLVLKRFFSMNMDEATRVMLHVHQKGVGVCGIFTYEVAETKVNQVMDFAREHQHPLQCTLEKI